MSQIKTILLALITLTALTAQLPTAQATEDDAGKQTADLLRDRKAREEYLKKNPQANTANNEVNKLTGGSKEKSDQIYNISAEVFEKMLKENGNDPVKLQEALMKAQKDPAAFLKSLPPEQRKAIEKMAKDIEAKK